MDGPRILTRLYPEGPANMLELSDFFCVYRAHGLGPELQRLTPLVRDHYDSAVAIGADHREFHSAVVFREHAAHTLLRSGQPERALSMLEDLLAGLPAAYFRIQARIQATAGEACRRLGLRRRAGRLLKQAAAKQLEHRQFGHLADSTYAWLAMWERSRRPALSWIEKAAAIQVQNRNAVGHARSLLLESRIGGDPQRAAETKAAITASREGLPALAQCPLLSRILENWDAWTSGEELEGEGDFWGL
jgi:hypothetical protein